MSEAAQQALKILISGEVDPRFNSAFSLADRRLATLGKEMYDLKKKQDLLKRFEMSTAGIDKTTAALQRTTATAEEMRREITRKTALGEVTGLSKLRRDLQATEAHMGDLGTKLTAQKAKWDTYQAELRETGTNLSDLTGEADRTAAALERASKQHVRLENAQILNRQHDQQAAANSSGHAMRNVAMGTAAAGYAANETILAPSIQAATTNEKSIRDIAITGGFAKTEKEEQLREFAAKASVDYYQKSGDVIETMASLVSQGLDDVNEIKEYAKNAAQAATAWNGNAVEMADLQFAYKKQLGLSKEDMRAALNITATGASQGSFEIKDMAKDMPVITSLLANLGMTGKDAVASGVAALETVRDTKGSSNETTTALAELLRQITSKETANAFKAVSMSKGRVLTEADKKAGEKGANIQELLKEQTSKGFNTLEGFVNITETYMKSAGMSKEVENLKYAKNDEDRAKIISKLTEAGALSELVVGSEASSALLALIAQKGRYTDIKGKGMDAATSGDKLQGDFELSADTTSKRLEKVHNQWDALLDTIGTAMQPGTVKKLDMLSAFMDKTNNFAADAGKDGFFPTLEKALGMGDKDGKPPNFTAMGEKIGTEWVFMWDSVLTKTPDLFAGMLPKLNKGADAVHDVLSGFLNSATTGGGDGVGAGIGKAAAEMISTATRYVIANGGKLVAATFELGGKVVDGAIGALKGFGTALTEGMGNIDLAGIGERVGKHWSAMWKTILRKTPDVFKWVVDTVNTGATAAATALGGFLQGADIAGMGKGLGNALGEMLDTALHFVVDNSGKLLAAGGAVGEWLIKGITGVVSGLGDRLTTAVSGISFDGVLTGIGSAIGGGLSTILKGALAVVPMVFTPLLADVFSKTFGAIGTLLSGFIKGIDFTGIGAGIGKGVNAIWDTVLQVVPAAFDAALNVFFNLLDGSVDLLTGFIHGVNWSKAGDSLGGAISGVLSSAMRHIGDDFPGLIRKTATLLVDGVIGLWDFIGSALTGLDVSQLGKDFGVMSVKLITAGMSMLWDGAKYVLSNIPDILGALVDGVGAVASGIIDFGLGVIVGAVEGLWDAIGGKKLLENAKTEAAGVFDAVKTKAGEFSDWVSDHWNALWDGVGKKVSEVSDWVEKLLDDLIGGIKQTFNDLKEWFSDLWKSIFGTATEKTEAFGKWWDAFTLKDLIPDFDLGVFDKAREIGDNFVNWWNSISLKSLLPDTEAAAKKAGEVTGNMINAGMNAIQLGAAAVKSPLVQNAAEKAIDFVTGRKNGKFDTMKAALDFKSNDLIAGMNAAQSRVYAANTMKTESGGKVNSVNSYGFSGQYQFGADALAEGGFVDMKALKAAKKAAGKQWYKGGLHKAFLQNDSNWTLAGGQQAFLSNKQLQDDAFIDYTNRNLKGGFRSGAINPTDDPAKIAAFAKAAHLKGVGGANSLFLHGKSSTDAYGTSTGAYAASAREAMEQYSGGVAEALKQQAMQPDGKRQFGGSVNRGGFYEVNETGMPELLNIFGKQFLMMGGNNASVQPLSEAANEAFAPVRPGKSNVVPMVTLASMLATMPAAAEPQAVHHHSPTYSYTLNVNQMPGEDNAALVRRLEKMIKDLQRPSPGALYDSWG